MANEAPSLTKATYHKKRTRGPAPCPTRRQEALNQTARDCTAEREFRIWWRKYMEERASSKPKPPIDRRF